MRVIIFLICAFTVSILILNNYSAPENPPKSANNDEPDISVRRETAKRNIRNVTPPNALPGPEISTEQISRLPDNLPPPIVRKPVAKNQVWKNLTVHAAGIIKSHKTVLHISNIVPLSLNETCKIPTGETWPCGRFARTALRQLIRTRPIECQKNNTVGFQQMVECEIGGQDIAAWLVKQGWARGRKGYFRAELEYAKTANLGMWRQELP